MRERVASPFLISSIFTERPDDGVSFGCDQRRYFLENEAMQKNLTFRLLITDDEDGDAKVADIALSYEVVSSIISSIPDSPSMDDVYYAAAMHPAPSVRESVAYKDKLSEKVFRILAEDNSVSVLRNLSRTDSFSKHADLSLVKRLIAMDSELAQNIAGRADSLEQVDTDAVLGDLISSRDPSIRYAVVNNWSAPKRFAKALLADKDSQVAEEAKRRLE